MDATLLELPPPTFDSDHESELVALVRSLRQEVAELRREVVDLRQQAHYWQTMHARAVEKGDKLQREIDQLRGENRQLKDRLYGIKSEKHVGEARRLRAFLLHRGFGGFRANAQTATRTSTASSRSTETRLLASARG